MAKVLLINPCSPERLITGGEKYIPLGPLYLSSCLKKRGHETNFIDFNRVQIDYLKTKGSLLDVSVYYEVNVKGIIADFKPDLIGVSVHYAGRFRYAMEICRMIKKDYTNIPLVIGGIHPTIFPGEILEEYDCVDFVLQGEGEVGLAELVETIETGDFDYAGIDGLGYKTKTEIFVNKKEHFIENVDEIPFPDYELVDIKDYYFDTSRWFNPKGLPINVSVYLLSSRSCPRQCTYCSMFMAHGPRYRMRSEQNVVGEIEYLYNKFGQRYFSFMDDNFTLNRKRAFAICEEIRTRGLDIQFDTPNGLELNTLDEEMLRALTGAGMVKTCLAVESGSEVIRKSINKRIKQEKIFEVFEAVQKISNLIYNVFFIVGFPNETRETLEETYQLIKKLELKSAVISFATPFPGTQLYRECAMNKLVDMDLTDLHNCEHLHYAHKEPFIKPYCLEKQDLIDFRLKVYKELNLTRYLKNLCV